MSLHESEMDILCTLWRSETISLNQMPSFGLIKSYELPYVKHAQHTPTDIKLSAILSASPHAFKAFGRGGYVPDKTIPFILKNDERR